ncbi:hypothetical protein RFI_01645 [Reticulomyxa filosa]|uniref:Uncharacterized protein n=1 Tax=Reticulomyxa filosa TaxID=46433 RepID=X6PBD0_RETFI|nr:hypothetical protein RFI_01645 [Reticulomyxa filosa]|eukprot:ETO35418.1 hypothetical protein RFI_01645 [Reticulomyxa filosa]
MISYTLFNHPVNYMLKFGQYLTFCNMARVPSAQISIKESIQSKNNIIRVFQSTFVKQSRNSLCTKTSAMNKFQSTSSITQTTYKLKIKAATFRYITLMERLNERKMVMMYCVYHGFYLEKICTKKNKNNNVLRNGISEVMISKPLFNTACNIQKRVWIGDIVCDQLLGTTSRQTRMQSPIPSGRFIFSFSLSNTGVPIQTFAKSNFTSKEYCQSSHAVLSNAPIMSKQIKKLNYATMRCFDDGKWKNDADWKYYPTSCNCWDKM